MRGSASDPESTSSIVRAFKRGTSRSTMRAALLIARASVIGSGVVCTTSVSQGHGGAGCRKLRKISGPGSMPSPVCRTSPVTPITVSVTLVLLAPGKMICLPTAGSPGHNRRAAVSLTTITPGLFMTS